MDEAIVAILVLILVPTVSYNIGKSIEGAETIRDCREFGKREAQSGRWIDCSVRIGPPSEEKK